MRKWLWRIGLGLALFIVTAAVANALQPAERRVSLKSAGYDFLAFYTAGQFVRDGTPARMYDLEAVRAFQQELARREGLEFRAETVGPFWNPPFYALPFVPLSALSYRAAFWVWTALNVACLAGASAILCRMVSTNGWRTWALVPLITLTSMPLIMAIGHGQNTCVSLLILCGAIALWRGGQFVAAGVVAGLLFYKPQLGMAVAAVLALCCGRRAIAGLALSGTALLLLTVTALPGTLAAFIDKMPGNLATMQVERPYLWDRHVTLKAFWRLLVQGFNVGEPSVLTNALWIGSWLVASACLIAVIMKLRREGGEIARDRIISLTVLAMPLLMPFYFDYDLLLLAVPATLAAREMITRGRVDRGVTLAWTALVAWLIVNPHVAAATRVNGTVVLLATVTAMTASRAMRRESHAEMVEPISTEPLRRAA